MLNRHGPTASLPGARLLARSSINMRLIERFEAGMHQFWPMPVESDHGEVVAIRYWFII